MAHILLVMDDTLQPTRGDVTGVRRELEQVRKVLLEKRSGSNSSEAGTARAGKTGMADEREVVRMDRVEALRAAIANGTYYVSAQELAEKILHSMLL